MRAWKTEMHSDPIHLCTELRSEGQSLRKGESQKRTKSRPSSKNGTGPLFHFRRRSYM